MPMMSLLQFGNYVFPQGFRLIRREPEMFLNSLPMSKTHGAYLGQFFRGGKTLTIEGIIGAIGQVDSGGAYYDDLDDSIAELNLMAASLRAGKQKLFAGYADGRYIVCQLKSLRVKPHPGSSRVGYDVSIELYANDPRWLGVQRSAHFDSTGAWQSGDGFAVPGAWLMPIGSAIMYPRFVYEGPLNMAPFVSFFYCGISQENIWYTWNGLGVGQEITISTHVLVDPWIAGGEEFIIDCDPFNRANAFTINGDPVAGWARMNGCNFSPNPTTTNPGGSDECFPFFFPTQIMKYPGDAQSDCTPAKMVSILLPASGYDVHWQEAWAF